MQIHRSRLRVHHRHGQQRSLSQTQIVHSSAKNTSVRGNTVIVEISPTKPLFLFNFFVLPYPRFWRLVWIESIDAFSVAMKVCALLLLKEVWAICDNMSNLIRYYLQKEAFAANRTHFHKFLIRSKQTGTPGGERKTKKAVILPILGLLFLSLMTPAVHAYATKMYVTPSTVTVGKIGKIFTVNVA